MIPRLIVAALSLVAFTRCKKPRDPRAIERLVPLSAARTSSSEPDRDPAHLTLPRTLPRARDAGVLRVITERPEPTGVHGVRFGMSRAEVTSLHRTANITCRDADAYQFCARALSPLRTEAIATYEYCSDRLCSVALDAPRTRDEGRIASDYLALAEAARAELGAPSLESHHVQPGCAGHLALCLASKQAEYTARWTFRQGFQAIVSADQDESDAFMAQVSVTYVTTERARRPDPEPQPSRTTADASTDAALPL